jgi:uncharacterized membrane protein YfcA
MPMTTAIDPAQGLLIIAASFFVGIFSVIAGGGMFFSMPFMQWLFPEVAFGVLVGNVKVGSLFRSIGSTWTTRKQIAWAHNAKVSLFAFIGTTVGSSFIANLSQKWMFPAVVLAVAFAILSPRVAHLVNARTFNLAAFLTGLYAGVFGAGIGLLLIALLRLKYTEDTAIAYVKIQARFVEMLLVAVAVATHFLHGNLVSMMWIPWSIGALGGGFAGGRLLDRLGTLPGRAQSAVLYFAFAESLIMAGVKFFE